MSHLRNDLEAPPEHRRFGTGWISGVAALVLAVLGLGTVLCLRYPQLLTVADARGMYNVPLVRLALHFVLIAAFLLGIVSLVLRRRGQVHFSEEDGNREKRVIPKNGPVPFTALGLVLAAALLGGSRATTRFEIESDVYFGLDWFLLNLLLTGIIFIPVERFLKRIDQPIFRFEWREDLLYFFVSSLLVQSLTYLSMAPSLAILKFGNLDAVRDAVGSQPLILQFIEIMVLTDLVQYWLHRLFHRVPWLWKFHAVHHSTQSLDWLAGSRMHLLEIVVLRGCTLIPMYVLGFSDPALYGYIFAVYLFSTLVHANLRTNFGRLERWLVTPRYHHWHHGIEPEAIDVNFAVHFPWLDRLFGTYHLPPDGRWPSGYGIKGEMPPGFLRQHLFPFVRRRRTADPESHQQTE